MKCEKAKVKVYEIKDDNKGFNSYEDENKFLRMDRTNICFAIKNKLHAVLIRLSSNYEYNRITIAIKKDTRYKRLVKGNSFVRNTKIHFIHHK